MLAWLSVWSEVQTCIWPSWCHCHSLSLASIKSRLVLPFWYRLTRVVQEKGPLNGCVCVCTLSSLILTEFLRPRRHLSATLRNAVNGHKLRELRRTPRVCSCALHSPTSPTAHAVLLCYHAEKTAALHFLSLNCLIILRSN